MFMSRSSELFLVWIVWLSGIYLCGVVAQQQGRNRFMWTLWGILATPVLTLLALTALSGTSPGASEGKAVPKTAED